MKRCLFILFLCCIGSGLAACQDEDHTVPTLPSENDPEINDPVVEFYDWEKNRTELLTSTDMVLLYGGGHHRTPYTWDKERVSSYIRYVDTDNQSHWLFDSFLFWKSWTQAQEALIKCSPKVIIWNQPTK